MPRALIVLLLGLQADAARYTLDAIRLRATAPLPSQQLEIGLSFNDRPLGEATVLYAEGAAHVALKGMLGGHGPVLRVAHGMVSVTPAPDKTWLAPDAGRGLSELFGDTLTPSDLVDLWMGRAPAGEWRLTSTGAEVRLPGVRVEVDRSGAVVGADVDQARLVVEGSRRTLQRGSLRLGMEVRSTTLRSIPDGAFTMEPPGQVQWMGR
jgi:hypothetical protein